MDKWKCTVCRFIMEADKEPKKCVHCGADPHKIRALFKKVRGWGWGRFMDCIFVIILLLFIMFTKYKAGIVVDK